MNTVPRNRISEPQMFDVERPKRTGDDDTHMTVHADDHCVCPAVRSAETCLTRLDAAANGFIELCPYGIFVYGLIRQNYGIK